MHRDLREIALYAGCLVALNVLVVVPKDVLQRELGVILANIKQPAATFFVTSTTSAEIRSSYQREVSFSARDYTSERKVHVLIVPGHRPDGGGTEFGSVYEREVVVDIADHLAAFLRKNSHYEVIVARDKKKWNSTLDRYFENKEDRIVAFVDKQKELMTRYINRGKIVSEEGVPHNAVESSSALKLYGINKWASENSIDITIHLHLNDYAGRKSGKVGEHSGFTVYVPDHQYSNAAASKDIGTAIANRLRAYHATSTLPGESAGVVEDQYLIAIGSNNTADGASVLIEYGYIYEPQFINAAVRPLAVEDYAYQTYLGLQDFFSDPVLNTSGSAAIPYDWSEVRLGGTKASAGVYALQSGLRHLGYYPPKGKSFVDCPISGVTGACTKAALKAYQAARGLTATGDVGPQTREALGQDLAAL
jgi:N-acetylmuramoyl-L-alanine amidase